MRDASAFDECSNFIDDEKWLHMPEQWSSGFSEGCLLSLRQHRHLLSDAADAPAATNLARKEFVSTAGNACCLVSMPTQQLDAHRSGGQTWATSTPQITSTQHEATTVTQCARPTTQPPHPLPAPTAPVTTICQPTFTTPSNLTLRNTTKPLAASSLPTIPLHSNGQAAVAGSRHVTGAAAPVFTGLSTPRPQGSFGPVGSSRQMLALRPGSSMIKQHSMQLHSAATATTTTAVNGSVQWAMPTCDVARSAAAPAAAASARGNNSSSALDADPPSTVELASQQQQQHVRNAKSVRQRIQALLGDRPGNCTMPAGASIPPVAAAADTEAAAVSAATATTAAEHSDNVPDEDSGFSDFLDNWLSAPNSAVAAAAEVQAYSSPAVVAAANTRQTAEMTTAAAALRLCDPDAQITALLAPLTATKSATAAATAAAAVLCSPICGMQAGLHLEQLLPAAAKAADAAAGTAAIGAQAGPAEPPTVIPSKEPVSSGQQVAAAASTAPTTTAAATAAALSAAPATGQKRVRHRSVKLSSPVPAASRIDVCTAAELATQVLDLRQLGPSACSTAAAPLDQQPQQQQLDIQAVRVRSTAVHRPGLIQVQLAAAKLGAHTTAAAVGGKAAATKRAAAAAAAGRINSKVKTEDSSSSGGRVIRINKRGKVTNDACQSADQQQEQQQRWRNAVPADHGVKQSALSLLLEAAPLGICASASHTAAAAAAAAGRGGAGGGCKPSIAAVQQLPATKQTPALRSGLASAPDDRAAAAADADVKQVLSKAATVKPSAPEISIGARPPGHSTPTATSSRRQRNAPNTAADLTSRANTNRTQQQQQQQDTELVRQQLQQQGLVLSPSKAPARTLALFPSLISSPTAAAAACHGNSSNRVALIPQEFNSQQGLDLSNGYNVSPLTAGLYGGFLEPSPNGQLVPFGYDAAAAATSDTPGLAAAVATGLGESRDAPFGYDQPGRSFSPVRALPFLQQQQQHHYQQQQRRQDEHEAAIGRPLPRSPKERRIEELNTLLAYNPLTAYSAAAVASAAVQESICHHADAAERVAHAAERVAVGGSGHGGCNIVIVPAATAAAAASAVDDQMPHQHGLHHLGNVSPSGVAALDHHVDETAAVTADGIAAAAASPTSTVAAQTEAAAAAEYTVGAASPTATLAADAAAAEAETDYTEAASPAVVPAEHTAVAAASPAIAFRAAGNAAVAAADVVLQQSPSRKVSMLQHTMSQPTAAMAAAAAAPMDLSMDDLYACTASRHEDDGLDSAEVAVTATTVATLAPAATAAPPSGHNTINCSNSPNQMAIKVDHPALSLPPSAAAAAVQLVIETHTPACGSPCAETTITVEQSPAAAAAPAAARPELRVPAGGNRSISPAATADLDTPAPAAVKEQSTAPVLAHPQNGLIKSSSPSPTTTASAAAAVTDAAAAVPNVDAATAAIKTSDAAVATASEETAADLDAAVTDVDAAAAADVGAAAAAGLPRFAFKRIKINIKKSGTARGAHGQVTAAESNAVLGPGRGKGFVTVAEVEAAEAAEAVAASLGGPADGWAARAAAAMTAKGERIGRYRRSRRIAEIESSKAVMPTEKSAAAAAPAGKPPAAAAAALLAAALPLSPVMKNPTAAAAAATAAATSVVQKSASQPAPCAAVDPTTDGGSHTPATAIAEAKTVSRKAVVKPIIASRAVKSKAVGVDNAPTAAPATAAAAAPATAPSPPAAAEAVCRPVAVAKAAKAKRANVSAPPAAAAVQDKADSKPFAAASKTAKIANTAMSVPEPSTVAAAGLQAAKRKSFATVAVASKAARSKSAAVASTVIAAAAAPGGAQPTSKTQFVTAAAPLAVPAAAPQESDANARIRLRVSKSGGSSCTDLDGLKPPIAAAAAAGAHDGTQQAVPFTHQRPPAAAAAAAPDPKPPKAPNMSRPAAAAASRQQRGAREPVRPSEVVLLLREATGAMRNMGSKATRATAAAAAPVAAAASFSDQAVKNAPPGSDAAAATTNLDGKYTPAAGEPAAAAMGPAAVAEGMAASVGAQQAVGAAAHGGRKDSEAAIEAAVAAAVMVDMAKGVPLSGQKRQLPDQQQCKKSKKTSTTAAKGGSSIKDITAQGPDHKLADVAAAATAPKNSPNKQSKHHRPQQPKPSSTARKLSKQVGGKASAASTIARGKVVEAARNKTGSGTVPAAAAAPKQARAPSSADLKLADADLPAAAAAAKKLKLEEKTVRVPVPPAAAAATCKDSQGQQHLEGRRKRKAADAANAAISILFDQSLAAEDDEAAAAAAVSPASPAQQQRPTKRRPTTPAAAAVSPTDKSSMPISAPSGENSHQQQQQLDPNTALQKALKVSSSSPPAAAAAAITANLSSHMANPTNEMGVRCRTVKDKQRFEAFLSTTPFRYLYLGQHLTLAAAVSARDSAVLALYGPGGAETHDAAWLSAGAAAAAAIEGSAAAAAVMNMAKLLVTKDQVQSVMTVVPTGDGDLQLPLLGKHQKQTSAAPPAGGAGMNAAAAAKGAVRKAAAKKTSNVLQGDTAAAAAAGSTDAAGAQGNGEAEDAARSVSSDDTPLELLGKRQKRTSVAAAAAADCPPHGAAAKAAAAAAKTRALRTAAATKAIDTAHLTAAAAAATTSKAAAPGVQRADDPGGAEGSTDSDDKPLALKYKLAQHKETSSAVTAEKAAAAAAAAARADMPPAADGAATKAEAVQANDKNRKKPPVTPAAAAGVPDNAATEAAQK